MDDTIMLPRETLLAASRLVGRMDSARPAEQTDGRADSRTDGRTSGRLTERTESRFYGQRVSSMMLMLMIKVLIIPQSLTHRLSA